MKYEHGTYTGYTCGGCRCVDCRRANRDYERARTRFRLAVAYGMAEPDLVDAADTRAHVQGLQASGMGYRAIAAASGVSVTVIARLLQYDTSRPAQRVRRATVAKLLAVSPQIAGGRLISAGASGRKVRALVAAGYSRAQLGEAIGVTSSNFVYADLGDAQLVTAKTAAKIDVLYRRLSAVPGTSVRARNEGRRRGWPPPLAWDDIDAGILADDQDDTDGCVTCEDVDYLAGTTSWADIAARVGLTATALSQHLYRHGNAHANAATRAERVAS